LSIAQGLIKAPQPASKRGDAAPPADDDDFWDKQGRNGVARQLQSTEDALPGGRPGSTQPEQPQSKGASSRQQSVQWTSERYVSCADVSTPCLAVYALRPPGTMHLQHVCM